MVYEAVRDHNLLVKCMGCLGGVRHLAQTPLLAFYICRQIIRYDPRTETRSHSLLTLGFTPGSAAEEG